MKNDVGNPVGPVNSTRQQRAYNLDQGWKKPMVFKLEICFFLFFYGFLVFRFKSRKPKNSLKHDYILITDKVSVV